MKTEKINVQKICLIAFAICINFVGGQIALFLKLPIYLDSIGTVFIASILGPFYGMLPNLISGLLMGRYLFKFHPALTLGCTAGARTTTAALGAIQDALGSDTPALGYTVTYAVGNTLLIIWGVAIVLLM